MVKLTSEKAKLYLSDVAGEYMFWLCDGRRLKNLAELADALKDMNEDVFNYHVNKEKNDFSKWISEIIGDKSLAGSIAKLKSRNGIMSKLQNRVSLLKSM